jgi:hypothetical protein
LAGDCAARERMVDRRAASRATTNAAIGIAKSIYSCGQAQGS